LAIVCNGQINSCDKIGDSLGGAVIFELAKNPLRFGILEASAESGRSFYVSHLLSLQGSESLNHFYTETFYQLSEDHSMGKLLINITFFYQTFHSTTVQKMIFP